MDPKKSRGLGGWGLRQGSFTIFGLTYLLAVSANLTAATFEAFSGRWWASLVLPVVVGVAFIASPWLGKVWPKRTIEPSARISRANSCRGLVVFVSPGRGSETAVRAVEYHGPALERVWLVHSDASRGTAEGILEELSQRPHLRREVFELVHLADAQFDNPGAVQDLIERVVFRDLPEGISERDLLIDLTGGMKGTSAGAFLAGLPRGRRLEYVPAARKDARGRGTRPAEPIEIGIDYKLKRVRGQ